MDWTQEAIDRLRALWAEGLSTAEIGRRMGVSKNAVVGKAHRLNLPPRPSPIRREATPRTTTPRPARTAAPRPAPAPRPAALMAPRPPAMAAPRPPQTAVVRPFPSGAPRAFGTRACCWPLGEPGTAEFRFCGCEAIPGKPYCPDHAALAYVKPRDRREDAA